MIDAPAIITDRLFLRPVELGDAVETSALMSPQIAANLTSWPARMTISEAFERISHSRCETSEGRWVDWGIFLKDDLNLIGWVGVGKDAKAFGSFRIGYWVGDIFQKQRYGTEAVMQVVARVPEIFGATVLHAQVLPTNASSISLLKRLGFAEMGRIAGDRPAMGLQEELIHYRLDLEKFRRPATTLPKSASA